LPQEAFSIIDRTRNGRIERLDALISMGGTF
jgi:hypothetical protein